MPLTHFKLSAKLAERHAQQRFRQCKTHDSPQGATLIHQGQTYLNFSSNDYLGLANHPLIKKAFIQVG
jgi:8-amino-7-oxononanoate synthase